MSEESSILLQPVNRSGHDYQTDGQNLFVKTTLQRLETPQLTRKVSQNSLSPINHDHHRPDDVQTLDPFLRVTPTRWDPGIFRHIPSTAILALCVALCATVSALIVLEEANGKSTADWKYEPTVYLAILSTIANISLSTARDAGAVLSWWRCALHGCDMEDLSRLWKTNASVSSALFVFKDFYKLSVHRLAIVKVFLLVVLINGPLLQRAVTVVSRERQEAKTMLAHVAPQVPSGYTASLSGRTGLYSPTDNYSTVMKDYSARNTMRSPLNATCDGTCTATILAAGLDASNCASSSYLVSYDDRNSNTNMAWLSFFSFTTQAEAEHSLNLTIGGAVIPPGSCAGHFITTTCILRSAVVRYPITIHPGDNSITFQSSLNLSRPEVFMLSNNTVVLGGDLYGLVATANERFNGSFSWVMDYIYGWTPIDANVFTMQYQPSLRQPDASQDYACPGSYSNPQNDILAAFNEILFRLSLYAAATDVDITQNPLDAPLSMYQLVNVTSNQTYNVYQVEWWPLWIAMTIMILGVLGDLWTLWGWWEIGINVSLDPIETAKAFSAPILFTGKQQAEEAARPVFVRYGAVELGMNTSVEPEHIVVADQRGTRSRGTVFEGQLPSRMVIAETQNVTSLRKGEAYIR